MPAAPPPQRPIAGGMSPALRAQRDSENGQHDWRQQHTKEDPRFHSCGSHGKSPHGNEAAHKQQAKGHNHQNAEHPEGIQQTRQHPAGAGRLLPHREVETGGQRAQDEQPLKCGHPRAACDKNEPCHERQKQQRPYDQLAWLPGRIRSGSNTSGPLPAPETRGE